MMGRTVAGYLLESHLGAGGFGDTWLAREPATGSRVVVKLFRADATAREALLREVNASRAVGDAPEVRTISETGGDGDALYAVYPWVDGRDLASALVEGPMPVADALAIARTVARGLAAIHRAGLVHRDIKPSNILLPARAEEGRAVLLDLGVSGVLQAATGNTVPGQLFGTPTYMSPEQVRGAPQSPAVDVHGLGMVLYEMLYGRRPFEAHGISETVVAILTQPFVCPPLPAVPAPVRRFVEACLAKDPARRPRDGAAAGALLDDLLRGATDEEPWVIAAPAGYSGYAPVPDEVAVQALRPLQVQSRGALLPIAAVVLLVAAGVAVAAARAGGHGRTATSLALVLAGVLLATGSVAAAIRLRRWLRARKDGLARDADTLCDRTHDRAALTRSIAIDISVLLARCRDADERILGHSIALLVAEFDSATASGDRQQALMNAMQLVERLSTRLAPWYVRNDKLLPAMTALIGLVSSALAIGAGLFGS